MLLMFLDRLWVWMGLRPEELREERGRGFLYAIVFVAGIASVILATDLLFNFSGRFG